MISKGSMLGSLLQNCTQEFAVLANAVTWHFLFNYEHFLCGYQFLG